VLSRLGSRKRVAWDDTSPPSRVLGATPRQVAAILSAVQLLPRLIGALLGIPADTELYAVIRGHRTGSDWQRLSERLQNLARSRDER
jgi:hypothetical protein